jgi:hypothetical protein
MAVIYGSFDAAARRVEVIKASYGVWPGIRVRTDGTFELTYEPEVTR